MSKVNASLNIMRKVVPNAFSYGIEGVVVHERQVNTCNAGEYVLCDYIFMNYKNNFTNPK